MKNKAVRFFLLVTCLIALPPEPVAAQDAPRPELYVQGGLAGKVNALAFSEDGKYLIGRDGNTILLWDVSSGVELRRFEPKDTAGTGFALSPDAKLIAVGNEEGVVELWDVAKGAISRKTSGTQETIRSLAFSPDGRLLAAGGSETVTLWDVDSGRLLASLNGHAEAITSVAFSPDGRSLASGGEKAINVWDVQARVKRKTFNVPDETGIVSLFFRHDGKLFAMDDLKSVREVASSWKVERRLWFEAAGGEAAFNPNSDLLALGHPSSGFIALLDLKEKRCVRTFNELVNNISSMAFTSDGKTMFVGYQHGDIRQVDLRSGRVLSLSNTHRSTFDRNMDSPIGNQTFALVLSPDGKYLFSAAGFSKKLWDAESGQDLEQLDWYGLCAECLAFSPDGKLVAATQINGVYPAGITLYEPATGKYLVTYKGHQETVKSLTFSHDGALLASGSSDATVRVWDLKQKKEIRTLEHPSPVMSVAFSYDRKLIASGGEDGKIRLWDTASGKKLREIVGLAQEVEAVVFDPSGRQIASLSNGDIKLWNVADGSRAVFDKTPNWIATERRFGFINLNGRLIQPVPEGKVIKLIDLDSRKELASLLSIGDKDWMVITPDGSFDSSSLHSTSGGWRQLLWRFNDNTFDYVPVEAFFGEFFRPGLLKEIIEGRRPPTQHELRTLDRRQPEVKLSLAVPPPPQDRKPPIETNQQVISCYPDFFLNDFALSSRIQPLEVEVAEATASDSASGIRDVRLFRNDSLVKVWRGLSADELARQPGCRQVNADGSAGRIACRADVSIVAGENRFRAYAFNHDNVKSNDAELILRGAESLKRSDATLYILAIGIDRYADASRDLRYAVADAEAIAAQIAEQQYRMKQYAKTEVIKLLDGNATKENILLALRRFAAANEVSVLPGRPADLQKIRGIRPEDALLIYFAGHGAAAGDRFYLIPHEGFPQKHVASPESLQRQRISDRELEAALERVDAGRMLLIIDACDSGQALESEEYRLGPMNSRGLAQLAYEKGFYILAAAQSRQAALEAEKFGHGLLTFALIEGFLKADANGDGTVTEREWFDYAAEHVPRLQFEAMKRRSKENSNSIRPAKRAELIFVTGDKSALPPEERGLQVPRSFYRTETESKPFVIATIKDK
jgi:WD40 repeat protein